MKFGACDNFVSKLAELVFNAFGYLEAVKSVMVRSVVTKFGSFDNSTCKRVLDLWEVS